MGSDWASPSSFVVTTIDEQRVVVGIDESGGTAVPLVVVPDQADDDRMLAPQIVQTTDGDWFVHVRKVDGKPGRLLRIDRAGRTLQAGSTVEAGLSLRTTKAGFVGVSLTVDMASRSTLVVLDGDLQTLRTIPVEVPATLLAAAGDTACVVGNGTAGSTVARVDTGTGVVEPAGPLGGFVAQAAACTSGATIVAGEGGPVPTDRTATLGHTGGIEVVSAAGRVAAVTADAERIGVVVATPAATRLAVLDRATGDQQAVVALADARPVLGLWRTTRGYLVIADEKATLVDLATGRTTVVDIPGRVTAVPVG